MLPKPSRRGRQWLKRFMYSQLSVLDAVKILLNKEQPRVPFTVKAEPASVYYNFRVKPAQLDAFLHYINLPEGFEVTPISCLEGEQADYIVTLNVYEVSGIAVGVRAEWSTYVLDAHGTPRYMVLEARSSELSMDPVDIITRKSRVEHSTQGGTTCTCVESLEGSLFTAQYKLTSEPDRAVIHAEWAAANDYIYWRNGICDRTFYDAGLAYPKAWLIDPSEASIDDQTHWATFLEPVPKHIVQFENAIDFVIMPWHNA